MENEGLTGKVAVDAVGKITLGVEKSVKAYKRKNKGKKLPWEEGYKFEK